MAPLASVASTTTRFGPSRSLSDALSETAGFGAFSSTRATSAPLTLTTTRLTPRPPVTTPASGTLSRSTRAWSPGLDTLTASGCPGAAGGAAGPGPTGAGGAAGAATLGAGFVAAGGVGSGLARAGAGFAGAGGGAGVGAGVGACATAVEPPAASNVKSGLLELAL